MAVTKDMPIFERVHMNLQAEVINLPNHPEWLLNSLNTSTTVQSSTFGTTGTLVTGARQVELRANVTF